MINAFTTDTDLSKAFKCGAEKVVVAAKNTRILKNYDFYKDKTDFYQLYDGGGKNALDGRKICLSSITLPDSDINALIEYILSTKAEFMAVCSRRLEEVGEIEARFHLSPVMLLNKLGLLENCTIIGGVYLDNDDIDLMIQQNARLVLTPSFDSGYGNGIANAVSYIKRGLKINLGTGDNVFNSNADILFEARLLELFSNGMMCSKDVIEPEILFHIINN